MSQATEQRKIPIAKPTMFGDELTYLQEVLESGWVSQGPTVQKFEQAICQYSKTPFAVAMTSWTTAMHVGLLLHQIGAGHDVICPSYSFIATANVVAHAGATPVFADINPNTLNICPNATKHLIETHYTTDGINKKTGNQLKAIQIVHQIGLPADIDAFAKLAKDHNLTLIEDSACATGSTYKGAQIGSSGFTGAFSFHPRKVLTTGEGGVLLVNSEEYDRLAKMYRTHGMDTSDLLRHKSGSTTYEQYPIIGYNYKMTDMQAALGLSQLNHLPEMLKRRDEIRTQYDNAFKLLEELSIVEPADYVTFWNAQSYPIRLKEGNQAKRDAFMQAMDQQGISTRRGIPPIHLEPAYNTGDDLPSTVQVSETSLFLPIYPSMTDDDVAYVINGVKTALNQITPTPTSVATA